MFKFLSFIHLLIYSSQSDLLKAGNMKKNSYGSVRPSATNDVTLYSTSPRGLKECMNCRFWKAKPGKQQMGELSVPRLTPSEPCATRGADLMGLLFIRTGRSSFKCYACIFSYIATRATYFEEVQSLESRAFIQAFCQFCNHRITRPRLYTAIMEGILRWLTRSSMMELKFGI